MKIKTGLIALYLIILTAVSTFANPDADSGLQELESLASRIEKLRVAIPGVLIQDENPKEMPAMA